MIKGVYITNKASDEQKIRFIDEMFEWSNEKGYTITMRLKPSSDRIEAELTK